MEKQQPIIKRQDGQLAMAVFKNATDDGKEYYSVQFQRSYKKKGDKEWTTEKMSMFPDDLLKLSNIAATTYTDIRDDMFKNSGKYTKPEETDIPF